MNCDKIAPWYRWLEYATFGPFLWQCRCAYLSDMGQARRILVVGDGDGRFLQALLKHNTHARIDCVDNSQAMIALEQSRVPAADSRRVAFYHANILDWTVPSETYELIVTHFVLDCFSPAEVSALIFKIAAGVAPGARWVISEFQVPARSPLRLLMSTAIAIMYRWFRWTTGLKPQQLPSHESLMLRQGFQPERRVDRLGGFLTSQQWVFAQIKH